MIVSGGLRTADAARSAYEESDADAVMIARGALGNPWIFEQLTGRRQQPPTDAEIVAELLWVIDAAERHLGPRAPHYLRKFYPWYLDRTDAGRRQLDRLQRIDDLGEVRALVAELARRAGRRRGLSVAGLGAPGHGLAAGGLRGQLPGPPDPRPPSHRAERGRG